MRTDELDFDLPRELIAQEPAAERTAARLMTYDRAGGDVGHRHVRDLPGLLRAGRPAGLQRHGRRGGTVRPSVKPTGGVVGGLRLDAHGGTWTVLLKGLGPIPDAPLPFVGHPTAKLRVTAKLVEGYRAEVADCDGDPLDVAGRMPLPPYVRRGKAADPRDEADRERYQTVFRQGPATSVAAPTAGLHFDQPLLDRLIVAGVGTCRVTLEVGRGTFKPVEAEDLADHPMHAETWHVPPAAAEAVNAAKRDGRRVIAVGTTACRTLESQPPGDLTPGAGETRLFITPPYRTKHVAGLLTNFHLPRSTLLALLDGFIGTDARRRLYALAVEERYRFFSYGDAMLVI